MGERERERIRKKEHMTLPQKEWFQANTRESGDGVSDNGLVRVAEALFQKRLIVAVQRLREHVDERARRRGTGVRFAIHRVRGESERLDLLGDGHLVTALPGHHTRGPDNGGCGPLGRGAF